MGIMSGLVVNGARIFELAASKDNRVQVKGDVHVMPIGSLADRAAPLQRMQQVYIYSHDCNQACDPYSDI